MYVRRDMRLSKQEEPALGVRSGLVGPFASSVWPLDAARRGGERRVWREAPQGRPAKPIVSTYGFAPHTPAVSLHGRRQRAQAGGSGPLGKEGGAAYTQAMKRPIVIGESVLLAALIISSGAMALAPSPRRDGRKVRAIALPETAVPLTLAVNRRR